MTIPLSKDNLLLTKEMLKIEQTLGQGGRKWFRDSLGTKYNFLSHSTSRFFLSKDPFSIDLTVLSCMGLLRWNLRILAKRTSLESKEGQMRPESMSIETFQTLVH